MFKKIILLCCVLCFLNCEQPKQTIETTQQHDSLPKTKAIKTVDETGFEPFDASEYMTTQLLIGKSEIFAKEKIYKMHIRGHDSYKINSQGLITALYNISNNYGEYTYTKSGLLKTKATKQHTPALTYYLETFYYKKDGTLQKSTVSRFDQQTKETIKETITDTIALQKNARIFKRSSGKASFKINQKKRIILIYGTDLGFCCGELMPGKNSLHYYYNENQLIDSLVINGLESPHKKMVFEYEYNTD
ncbi:MAG: hypothetical protein AB8B65_14860 [Kordia sp.]|uniref:hypothetical protein n=1 Tax=Kordia sp. TaxID=1965332 RepID=UPI00385FD322